MILVKPSFTVLTGLTPMALEFIELAGRTCYKSEDRITEDSASAFCKKIKSLGHESVIEHWAISVKFIIDRGVSHELVRHRIASFSQESTRYCNYGKKGQVTFVIPPWANIEPGEYQDEFQFDTELETERLWYAAMLDSEYRYLRLLEQGWQPQQARSVLPNSLKTEIVVTANPREWRHIFKLRCSKAAHPQMREIMEPVRNTFQGTLPELFVDA